ncbi:hypothetical protein ACBQ81_12090, partial [Escherichia coli]
RAARGMVPVNSIKTLIQLYNTRKTGLCIFIYSEYSHSLQELFRAIGHQEYSDARQKKCSE